MELLEKLTKCISPSGREGEISDLITSELKNVCDEIYKDALGNLICHKKGNGKKLMIAAHMDEIGFFVNHIDENGFIRFSTVGGVSKANVIDTAVKFTNKTVGKMSYETNESASKAGFDKMFIDIGANTCEEAEKLVSIGDFATFYPFFSAMENKIMAKALDDRAGCWALIRAMQNIKDIQNDVYAVFTVQEEVGLRGAKTAVASVQPDMAIAIDVSFTTDTPEAEGFNLHLGKGPSVKIKDASFIIHEGVKNIIIDSAKKEGIAYQLEATNKGGTDAGAMQLANGGCAAGAISIPTRYIHSSTEVIDRNDLENTAVLIRGIISNPVKKYLF